MAGKFVRLSLEVTLPLSTAFQKGKNWSGKNGATVPLNGNEKNEGVLTIALDYTFLYR